MMADEDEEVVFENSALHQHLKNVGFEENEVLLEKRNLQQELDISECRETAGAITQPADKNVMTKPTNTLHTMMQWSSMDFIHHYLYTARREAECKHGRLFYHCLLPNFALEIEDRNFLVNFIEDEADMSDESALAKSWWMRPVSVLVLLICYLIPRMIFSLPVPGLLSDLVVFILVGFGIGPRPVMFIAQKHYEAECQKKLTTMNKTVESLKLLKTTSKKAVRLIQEMELVIRGFTLVTHTAPLSWLEKGSGSQRQCLELRKVLFNTCRGVLLISRKATLKLIQQCHVTGEVLEGGSYLAHVPLEEYGVLVVSDSEEMLQSATDNYSISAIKAMVQLHNWYMSEMLKRLAVGLLLQPNTKLESSVLSVSADVMAEIYEDLQNHLQALNMCYKLHQCAVADTCEEPSRPAQKSHASNVYTAVHSLNLHLQAALKKVQKLEEKLEPLCPEDECSDPIDISVKEKIASEFAQLFTDLDSCKDCVEEGISRLQKQQYPPKPEMQPSESEIEEEKNQQSPIPVVDTCNSVIGDPIIEDQVFEAYTDPNEGEEDTLDLELMFSEEERERKKCERKNAKRVIRELNNRIAVKGWEREADMMRNAGKEIGQTKPPEPVAIYLEDEDDEVDFPKKNAYAAVLLEYEKQWKEMDTILLQENKDGSSKPTDSLEEQLRFNFNGDPAPRILNALDNELKETGEILQTSKLTETESNEEVSTGNATPQHGTNSYNPVLDTNSDQSLPDLVTSQSNEAFQIGDYESENGKFNKSCKSNRAETRDSENCSTLKQKLQHIPGVGFGFSENVAALASQRSQKMGLVMDTFGDSDDENEINNQG